MDGRSIFFRILLAFGAAGLLAGCCHSAPTSGNSNGSSTPQSHARGQFILSGAVAHPGLQSLQANETISQALAHARYLSPNPFPATVVLIRHGPDGKTRELINVGANGQLMEPKQDYALRDGDELAVPIAATQPATVHP